MCRPVPGNRGDALEGRLVYRLSSRAERAACNGRSFHEHGVAPAPWRIAPGERRSLRKLSGGLLAVPAAAAPADRCDLSLRAQRRRHRRRRRCDARPAPGRSGRGIAPTSWRRSPAGPPSPRWPEVFAPLAVAIARHRLPRAAAGRSARRVRAGRRARRATPTAPSCSTTAGARPTRSAACCCTSTASTTPRALARSDAICSALQLDQLLAGPRRRRARGRLYVPLGRRVARTASRSSELLARARQRPRPRASSPTSSPGRAS